MKNCPFCGKAAAQTQTREDPAMPVFVAYIECANCNARSQPVTAHLKDDAERVARDLWDMRSNV